MLKSISIYPIKSLNGIELSSAEILQHGISFDRNWMLVDAENKFITRRERPELSLVKISLNEEGFQFSFNTKTANLSIHANEFHSDKIESKVWDSEVFGYEEGENFNSFFSDFLKEEVRLIRMPLHPERMETSPLTGEQTPSSFADSFPILIIGTASLDALNAKLEEPIDARYFRPNLLFKTERPFEEDEWQEIKIGNVLLRKAKPCGRCRMINVNPDTGIYRTDVMRELAKLRTVKNKVILGDLYYPIQTESIDIHSEVKVFTNFNP
jgi:uncharacterized protein YcbX